MSLAGSLAEAPPATAGPTPEKKPAARIGDRLLDLGLITLDQLEVALFEQKRSGRMLGTVLVDLGFIRADALASLLAESSGYEQFDPKTAMVDPEVVARVPKEVATRHRVVPLSSEGRHVFVAMCDPHDVLALDQLRRQLGSRMTVVPRVCPPAEIGELIDRAYGYAMSIDGIMQELESGASSLAGFDDPDAGYAHPLVRLVDAILLDAVKTGASDIHFEPEELFLRLRYRIDGAMSQIRSFHHEHWSPISQRLKIMAGMNIADRLRPQDGRIGLNLGNREIDLRVSSLPTVHGENIVLRVLDKTRSLVPLDQLGISAVNQRPDRARAQAARGHLHRHRPDRQRQDHHALRHSRPDQHRRGQHRDARGPGRVSAAAAAPDPGAREHRARLRRRACAPCCARTRTSCSSARCAMPTPRPWRCARP